MKNAWRCIPVLTLLFLATPRPAEAQIGAILDWIHRLSGPPFVGGAVTLSTRSANDPGGSAERDWRVRGTFAYRTSYDTDATVTPAGSSLTMYTFQGAFEHRIANSPFEFGVGFGTHRFGGDADSFPQYSINPYVQAVWYFSSRVGLRAGGGAHMFGEFGTSDFSPLTVAVPRDVREWVPTAFIGLEYSWR